MRKGRTAERGAFQRTAHLRRRQKRHGADGHQDPRRFSIARGRLAHTAGPGVRGGITAAAFSGLLHHGIFVSADSDDGRLRPDGTLKPVCVPVYVCVCVCETFFLCQ